MTAAERYARWVLADENKGKTGRLIKLAAKRFLSDLQREDIEFNVKEASRAVNFIERKLRHWEGSWRGNPIVLEDWQKFIVMQIFGWYKDGKKLIRSAYVQVARKNGKTSFAAAIILYHLIAGKENTPQILVGANNEEQAKICTNSCGRMIQQSPELAELVMDEEIKLSIYGRNIIGVTYTSRDGAIKPMSKNPETQDGFNASLGVIDEYHEAKDDRLLNVIESGQGARPEPLLLTITTAGFDKDGPCYSKLRAASVDILEGVKSDDTHLAFIYEPDEGDDWKDPDTWGKSNPNLGVSVFPEYLKARLQKALNEGASKEVDFRTKNLNTWVDAPTVWISTEVWKKNRHGLTKEDLLGRTCYGGLDLSSGIDLNAFVLFFPEVLPNVHAILPYFFVPKDNAVDNRIKMDYRDWIREGHIIATDGNIADHDAIAQFVINETQRYDLQVLGFDQRMAYHGVVQTLVNAGIDCQPFGQGILNMSTPTKELERMAHGGLLEHFDHPVLAWNLACTTLRKDSAGNIMPDKGKSTGKIDGIAALVDAIGVYQKFPVRQESVYATRGVITI